jgi:hypothetical protein
MDPFESPYLNPVQLVTWAMTRNRELVAMAAAVPEDRARWDRKTARVAHVTTEGATVVSTVEFKKPAGPISFRWLDVWLALHPRSSKIPRRMTLKIINHLLTQRQLHATGRRCGRGDRQSIDPPAWADLELVEGFPRPERVQAQSKLAGGEDVFWTDCLFPSDEALVFWPPITKLVFSKLAPASERGESSAESQTPQPAAASPAVEEPPLAATSEEAPAERQPAAPEDSHQQEQDPPAEPQPVPAADAAKINMYHRIHQIRNARWPDRSGRPKGSAMADYVRRTAAEQDLHNGGQEAKIAVADRALAQICDESYPAKVFRSFLAERRKLKR